MDFSNDLDSPHEPLQRVQSDPLSLPCSKMQTSAPASPSRAAKLKRPLSQRQKLRATHPKESTPSVKSTTSSLSDVKNLFSNLVGNLRAGVSGAWTKARGEYDTYLASQEGESRMQRRRRENIVKSSKIRGSKSSDDLRWTLGKRPLGDGTFPASKKRTMKLSKQKSSTKLGGKKMEISKPLPPVVASPVKQIIENEVRPVLLRPPPAPVYRGRADSDVSDDGLQSKVHSLETEVSTLRAKLRWFEQSYGEIPADSMAEIQHSLTDLMTPLKKPRQSVFKEELGSMTHRDSGDISLLDQSFLPQEIKQLKGFDRQGIDIIDETAEDYPLTYNQDTRPESQFPESIAPETTVRLLEPSPSSKSIGLPSSPTRHAPSPTRRAPSPPYITYSSPTHDFDKTIDLLETLSPIHPNIIPAMQPRIINASRENMPSKRYEYQ